MSGAGPSSQANGPSHAERNAASPDTGYTFTDDPWIRWRNVWRYLTGGLTAEGEKDYRLGRDLRMEESDCKRCETQRDFLLQYSPIIRFLNQKITTLGGDLHRGNIICQRCTRDIGGGLDPNYGILLCANRWEPFEDVLAHEMVHAYDFLRFNADMATNLRHAACAEIRASSLSGECKFWREFWDRAQWKLTYQHQECVRRRATISVAMRPNCKDDVEAAKVVNEVWDSCFADTRPFDEIYK